MRYSIETKQWPRTLCMCPLQASLDSRPRVVHSTVIPIVPTVLSVVWGDLNSKCSATDLSDCTSTPLYLCAEKSMPCDLRSLVGTSMYGVHKACAGWGISSADLADLLLKRGADPAVKNQQASSSPAGSSCIMLQSATCLCSQGSNMCSS